MKKLGFIILACLPFLAGAQKKTDPATFAKSITAADLKQHLYVVAGPEMGGRDTPSPGLDKAADYIETYFRNLGLVPGNGNSYRQFYPLYRDSMTSSSLRVNGTAFELNKDFQPGNSNYSAEMRFSELVFAGYGIMDSSRNDYGSANITGKLVMILDGTPADYKPSGQGFRSASSSFGKLNAAMSKGAAAVIIVGNNFPRRAGNTVSNWSMNSYRATQAPFTFTVSPAVAAAITGEDLNSFTEKIKSGALTSKTYRADIDLGYSKTTRTAQVSNVMGLIEGTDKKDEYVIITAHYDHVGKRGDSVIYYGADDDGSGTVTILELAEAFTKAKQAGKGPRRSILLMTVSGEEKGLWGSEYYSNNPVYPLDKTTVNLNIDMIGRIGSEYQKDKDSVNYVYVIGDDKLSSDLTPITDQVNARYAKMKLDRKYNDPKDPNRFYYRSDHYNFAEKGVPVIFYFNGVHADYHRPTDTPDKINYSLMAKRGQFIFYTAWEMANREQMLKRDIPLNMASRN